MIRISPFVFLLALLAVCTDTGRAADRRTTVAYEFPAFQTTATDTTTIPSAEMSDRPERPPKAGRRHLPTADTAAPANRFPVLTLFEAELDIDSLTVHAADTLPQADSDTILPLSETLNRFSHDQALDSLLQIRLAHYKRHPTQGYSVLFFSASGNHSGAAAEQAEEFFQFLYPDTPTYLSYDAPSYKLKAGNFRTRLEASAFLAQIQNDYPNAFVVRDVLDIKHLLLLDVTEAATAEAEAAADTTDAEDGTEATGTDGTEADGTTVAPASASTQAE